MLTLNLRECWLGPKYSGKVETVNGQKIRPLQFEIDSMLLSQRELNALLGQPNAWTRLYQDDGSGGIVPFLKGFKVLELEAAIKDAAVRIQFGEDFEHEMYFTGCKLRQLRLGLCDGGETALSCQVKTKPTLDDTLADLFEYFDERVRAELIFAPPNAQEDLPLSTVGLSEQPIAPTTSKAKKRRAPRAKRSNGQGATVQ